MKTIEQTKRIIQNLKAAGLSYEQCYRVLSILALNMRFARYWGIHRNRAEYYFSEIPSGTKYFTSPNAFNRWFLRYYRHEAPLSVKAHLMHRCDEDGTGYFVYLQLQEECE